MNIVQLILLGIQSINQLLNNPALGGGSSVKAQEASELLGILAMLITEGEDAYEDLKEFTQLIKTMAEEGRAPTRVEWENLRAREQLAHERLQAVKEELTSSEEEPEEEEE